MAVLLKLLGLLAASSVLFLVVAAIVAAILRMRPTEINCFVGPRIMQTTICGIPCNIRALPLAASLTFCIEELRASRLRALAMFLLPWTILLALASLLLPDNEARFGRVWVEAIRGTIQPWSAGSDLLVETWRTMAERSLAWCFAAGLSAIVAVNLLPFPPLGGWSVVDLLLRNQRTERLFSALTGCGLIAFVLSWLVAIVAAVVGVTRP